MYSLSVMLVKRFLTYLSYQLDNYLLLAVVRLWLIRQSLSHLTCVSTGNAKDKLLLKLLYIIVYSL